MKNKNTLALSRAGLGAKNTVSLWMVTTLITFFPCWVGTLQADSLKGSGAPISSLRGGIVEIGGELELEYVKSEKNDDAGNNSHARMKIDKMVITPKAHFNDHITLQSDIEAEPDKPIKVDEAWVLISGLPYQTWIKLGLEDIFMKPHRTTESYPVLGHAFWQDEDLGVFLGGDGDLFHWRASLTNGRRLKDRKIQEDSVYPISTDDDDNVEMNSNKQAGVGIGVDLPIGESTKLHALPFYYTATLSDDDIAYLQGISTYGASEDDSQDRFGVNVELSHGGATVFAQFMQATDGELERDGWYIQPSFKLETSEHLPVDAVEFLLRYEDYNVDLDKDVADSRTWDRQTTTVAIIAEIVKNLKAKFEYYINDEDTGNGEVDNDELLVQLEARF